MSTQVSNYEPVKLNAMKHGILSKNVVLPHEDGESYDALITTLLDEHQPQGLTEQHLVEELASIMWRKTRVLVAEGATINRGIRTAISGNFKATPDVVAAPLQRGLSSRIDDLGDLLTSSLDELQQRQREAESDLGNAHKAITLLSKGTAKAYEKALNLLSPDNLEWWCDCVEEGEYAESVEDLSMFLSEDLEPYLSKRAAEAAVATQYQQLIKTQTLGDGVEAAQLLNLARYETHRDRKFERSLAMLLKLKEMR